MRSAGPGAIPAPAVTVAREARAEGMPMDEPAPRRKRAPLIVAGVLIAAVVAGLAVIRDRLHPAGSPTGPVANPVAEDAAPAAPATAEPAPAGVADTGAAPPVEPSLEAPTFDVVRVEPDGSTVVAGTAAPGAEVTVYADSAPLAAATADADGNFVALFRAEPSGAPRALTLGAGDLRSDDTVLLLPNTPAPSASAPSASAPSAPASSAPAQSAPEGVATATATPGGAATAEPAAAPEVAATAIIRADSVEVLPAPGSGGRVALGSISYTEAGAVTLAGVGAPGSAIRAYVDGRLSREATVDGSGRWAFALDDVAAGLYTLRIDQVSADGKVASRVETPFQRDYPRAPLPRPGGASGDAPAPTGVPLGGAITVQPGNNLWTIAREHYGSGVLYTQIFTANRALIRDPERIYPGQIFTMPELAPEIDTPAASGTE